MKKRVTIGVRRTWEVKKESLNCSTGLCFAVKLPTEGKLFFRDVKRGGLLGNISNVTYTVGIWPEILFRPESRHSQHFSLCKLEQH